MGKWAGGQGFSAGGGCRVVRSVLGGEGCWGQGIGRMGGTLAKPLINQPGVRP